jgi:hypothetical protein
MTALGLSKHIININSFLLQERIIRTTVNSTASCTANIHASVPQGCVLSPVLFNIITNDLLVDDGILVKYADDITLVKSTSLDDNRNNEWEAIQQWASSNHMTINFSKTKVMVINFKKS